MKANLYDSNGNNKGQIELPSLFSTQIREDIVLKCFEAEKVPHPYTVKYRAGLRHAAFGRISHKRHDWKNQYGRGVSRIPRKTMWRRGTQFYWVGASMPGTRGGRKAHPPKGIGVEKKINRKEMQSAMNSAFAATAKPEIVLKRYQNLDKADVFPAVIESLPSKTKQFSQLLKKIFGENIAFAFKTKVVRAGKGKLRGRKYKSNAGALIVVSSDEHKNFKGLDVKSVKEIRIADLYPLGRLTIYTQKSLEEISESREAKK